MIRRVKKALAFACGIAAVFLAYSEGFQISDVDYSTEGAFGFGKTSPYALALNVEVDKNRVFESEEEFLEYEEDYVQRLYNTRLFSEVDVSHSYEDGQDGITKVSLSVSTKDSIHILAFPYPKYDSNSGFTMKVKGKDNNFLGSMNDMSAELNLSIKDSGSEDSKNKIGLGFAYDHPFRLGIFDAAWINDYSFSYNLDETSPEWELQTGLRLTLPFERISYVWEFDQYFTKDLDYEDFGDDTYFTEYFKFSVPIIIHKIDNWGNITYTPYASVTYNWDFNGGIDSLNSDLSSPLITAGHSIGTERIDWHDNLRSGLSASVGNSYSYNTQRYTFTPTISTEILAFKTIYIEDQDDVLGRLGLAADFYAFIDIQDPHGEYVMVSGTSIGSRLRGIRDDLKYDDTDYKMCNVISAFVLSLDMPVHFFTTSFETKVLNKLNVDVQLSPFVDIALTHNKITDRWFDPRDGFYCGGLEVLIYPLKWSGFVLRASAGVDLARTVLKKLKMPIENDWRAGSKYEISIGLGLQY